MAILVQVCIQLLLFAFGGIDCGSPARAPCPDEILLSSDKTIAVIDGSGVLADPAGINREELVRLAKLRVPVENFDKSKLSKDGYLVRIEDQDVKLPCMSNFETFTGC